MYKALGIILIFFSLGLYTYIKVNEKKERLMNLSEMKKAVTFIKNELRFSMPKINSLCEKVSHHTKGRISYIFDEMKKLVQEDSNLDFYASFKQAASEKKLFSKVAEKEIESFLKEFGKKTIEIEIENVKKTEKILETLTEEEKTNYEKDRKLIYTLTASAGAVAVILLI